MGLYMCMGGLFLHAYIQYNFQMVTYPEENLEIFRKNEQDLHEYWLFSTKFIKRLDFH